MLLSARNHGPHGLFELLITRQRFIATTFGWNVSLCPPLHSLASVFQEASLVAEIADQVERYPERDDILVEKQAQKTHIPYAVNGNGRAGCSDKHSADDKEHHYGYEATYDAGFRPEIACDKQ